MYKGYTLIFFYLCTINCKCHTNMCWNITSSVLLVYMFYVIINMLLNNFSLKINDRQTNSELKYLYFKHAGTKCEKNLKNQNCTVT